MNIFVINLERDTSKRKYIEKHFSDHQLSHFQFISAVDGKSIPSNELAQIYSKSKAIEANRRALIAGEIGCALSHLICYKKIITQNTGAFIFEDDCKLNDDTVSIMHDIDDKLKNSSAPVVTLLSLARYVKTRSIPLHLSAEPRYGIREALQAAFTHAYYITPAAAKIMLQEFQVISRPIDSWGYLRKHTDIQLLCIYPYCVSTDEGASSHSALAQERLVYEQRKKSLPSRIAKWFREKVMKTYLQYIVYLITGIKSQKHTW